MSTVKKGDLAICSRGELGLITSDRPQSIVYRRCLAHQNGGEDDYCQECERGVAWLGIHLIGEKAGQPWSSRAPRKVATLAATGDGAFRLTPWCGYGAAVFYSEEAVAV